MTCGEYIYKGRKFNARMVRCIERDIIIVTMAGKIDKGIIIQDPGDGPEIIIQQE